MNSYDKISGIAPQTIKNGKIIYPKITKNIFPNTTENNLTSTSSSKNNYNNMPEKPLYDLKQFSSKKVKKNSSKKSMQRFINKSTGSSEEVLGSDEQRHNANENFSSPDNETMFALLKSDMSPITINLANDEKLSGTKIVPKDNNGKAVILYSGTGDTNFSQLNEVAVEYIKQGCSVYMVDYRGFGKSSDMDINDMGQDSVYSDADAIFDYVNRHENFPASKIILHGYSLGGAVASHVALKYSKLNKDKNLGGLIMHSAIDSVQNQAKLSYGSGSGFVNMLAGIVAKMGVGDFNSKKNLKKLKKVNKMLKVVFISGKYIPESDIENLDDDSYQDISDNLSESETNLSRYVLKENILDKVETSGGHMKPGQHVKQSIAALKKLIGLS